MIKRLPQHNDSATGHGAYRRRAAGLLRRHALAAALGASVLIAGAPAGAQERIELPDIGLSAGSIISPQEERAYRNALMRQLRAFDILVDDPLINDYFSDLGFRLVSHSDEPSGDFEFIVIRDGTPNAFAAPGGLIAMHTGMLLAAQSESEVAAVLAHEVAHVTQAHLVRAFENARQMSIPLALALLGLIIASGGSGEAIQGGLLSASALSTQSQINFTRQNEQEADRLGIQTLADAGFDPAAMASIWGSIQRAVRRAGSTPPEFLRTHPVNASRIAEAKDRAAQINVQPKPRSKDFYLVQARLRALQEEFAENSVRYFTTQLNRSDGDPLRDEANRYGLAIAAQRAGQMERAAQLIDELIDSDPERLTYQLQRASLEREMGQTDAALERLSGLHRRFEGNNAIALHYIEALLEGKAPQQAVRAAEIIRDQLLIVGRQPRLFDLYARAALIANDTIRAGEAIAESLYLKGQLWDAIQTLQPLAKRSDLDYYQHARINARLSEWQAEFAERGNRRPAAQS